jgi:hypothetical protein
MSAPGLVFYAYDLLKTKTLDFRWLLTAKVLREKLPYVVTEFLKAIKDVLSYTIILCLFISHVCGM